jgi:UDP-glucuronate 4-epimerase
MQTILVTGAAGFIGYHLSKQLLDRGDRVIGIDNLNSYYDVTLKESRLKLLTDSPGEGLRQRENFTFHKIDLADREGIDRLFALYNFEIVVNLAAQAGVRYSLTNPRAYIDSNITGFSNILEGCRHHAVKHLVYASSSSVYGANTKMPFAVTDNVDRPISLYAATKKSNELMAHTYSHLYKIPTTGLRFFTVYGPWGRPDMAPILFTEAILAGKSIDVFNYGKMRRDFTYIDDIVEGVLRVMQSIPQPNPELTEDDLDPNRSKAPYKLYNIGNSQPIELLTFIEILETCLGKTANKNFLPLQAGDVVATYADVTSLMADVGFQPKTSLQEGIAQFVNWYLEYYKINAKT